MADIDSLKDFSTQELLEEVSRRKRTAENAGDVVENWCADCANFNAAKAIPEKDLDKYNPCIKGHTMDFKMPEGYCDDFGFYRVLCSDRESLPQPTQPEPPRGSPDWSSHRLKL
jgi:hypothetical protein